MTGILLPKATPRYIALSTDVSGSKVAGIGVIGAEVYFTDTEVWNVVDENQKLVELVGTTRPETMDETTGATPTIDYPHHELHEGEFFSYTNAADLTNVEVVSFVLITPNTTKWDHFGFELEGEAEFDLQLFEDATPSASGSLVTNPAVINNNRNSSGSPTLLIYAEPVLGGGSKGTLIKRFHSGAGKKSGGIAGTPSEIILKQNTKYWVDLKNEVATDNFIGWVVGWYEHTNRVTIT